MARICLNCGTASKMGSIFCPRCGNSLMPVIDNEISALNEMRIYSMLFMLVALLEVASYILEILGTGNYVMGGFLTFLSSPASGTTTAITPAVVLLDITIVLAIFIQAVSFVYLRTCFSKLLMQDYVFSTPKSGTSILIIGLTFAMFGVALILAMTTSVFLTSQGGTSTYDPGLLFIFGISVVLALLGVIIAFIGYIMGPLLGIHRLATKFEEPMLDIGWVLLIVSLFFTPLVIISGILFLHGSNVTKRRLNDVKSNSAIQTVP